MLRLTIILGILTLSTAAEPSTKGVDLKLISSVKGISPNATFTLGVEIRHHPGFHTYWKNPGAVGYPTRIHWKLPQGFTVGPLRWPAPEMSDMAGNPVFGYKSDVTLLVDLTAPGKLDPTVEIDAAISWMACSRECHPGTETFSLSLPSSAQTTPDPATKAAFLEAERQIPQELKAWDAIVESKNDDERISLLLIPPAGIQDFGAIRFFSSDGQISSDPAPRITKLKDGRIRITAPRARFSPENVSSLPFVIVAEKPLNPDGSHFGTLDPCYPTQGATQNDPTP
ncbi:protein-disulfide reductase DsbD domain-containing protein [Haloferula chungangensis]|uniref:Protein-disulfide reductase DsbD domain-containing protein n=1 Tax=Haloferula chungangensis TaxID=1048331 RepID=A0ABW2L9G8_9BACT